MKKITSLLLVLIAALGMKAQDPNLATDYNLVKSFTTGGDIDLAIGTQALSIKAYETGNKIQQPLFPATTPEEISGWIAFQGVKGDGNKGWWNRSGKGLYSYNGPRSAAVYGESLTLGSIVAFTCDQDAANVMTLTNGNGEADGTFSYQLSEDGKTYFCTITENNGYVGFCGNKSSGYIKNIAIYQPKKPVSVPTAPTWDFGALYKKHGNKAKVTYTDETIKLGGADCNICTGDYEGLAMQGADKWITYQTGGLYNLNGGGRNLGILNLKKDQIVTIIADAECLTLKNDESTAIQSSVKNTDGKYVYTYIMVADAALVVNMARNYTLFSINIETPDPNANIPVTGITLNKSTAEVTIGMTVNLLSATISPVNATDKSIVWSSSNEAVATVDNGVVTGKTIGTATITAKAGEVTASCEITVKEKANKSFWDFASLYEKLGNKKAMTYAINTIKVGNIDCEYGIGEYEGLAMQAAGGWMLYSSGGLYQGNSGGRNIGVLDLEAGQIVTIIANNSTCLTLVDATTASQISIETTDDKSTYTYVMNTDGILALNMTRNYTLFSINVEDARELTLTEGADLTASGVYSSATYTREIAADTYGTICLPFEPDAETLENYSFFRLESEEEGALNFVEEATPAANTPYLYCLKEGKGATAITGGVTAVSTTMNDIVAGGWTMKGSFTNQTIATAETDTKYYGYAPANNQVVKANKTLTILPYRAYFTAPKDAANVRVRITRGDETTAIDNAQLTIDNSQLIYDLQGRRVESMTKGIYIVNGKKVIF